MKILGIETSCDETAASVIEGSREKIDVLSNIISSQINIHKKYGGVVPEVAAREHVLNILSVVDEALKKAGIKKEEAPKKINAIAVSVGPGLITSLIVGIETAKILSYVWNIPVIGVNHVEGHIYANFVNANSIKFPAIVLTVSGGHTMLVLMRGHGKYKTIGETRDDAAGEAFDKAAKLMNLGYPGGPAIAANAAELRITCPQSLRSRRCRRENQELRIKLPRPMINSNDFDFSFSGLKTALMYELKKDKNWKKKIPEYCAEFQQAVVDVLINKTIKAAKKYNAKTVMLTGGVAANKNLREQLKENVKSNPPAGGSDVEFNMPALEHTTDNAVMIAAAGYYRAQRKDFTPWQKLKVDCNLEL